MPGPRLEPFQQIAQFVAGERKRYAEKLCAGGWTGELAGKELTARIAMCDTIYEKMRAIAGGNSHFGEEEIE